MDQAQVSEKIIRVIVFFIPFLFSLCFHEFAHGWVARKRGDNTAYMMGRLTMNPMAHIDILGTVILPIIGAWTGMTLFGWAKPVPVNSRNLYNPRNDMFLVALAGPMSNILLFFAGLVGFYIHIHFFQANQLITDMILMFLMLNLMLAFFNLLPIHPLDGGKIIGRLLPIKWEMWLERYERESFLILMLLVIVGGFKFLALPIYWIVNESILLIQNL